MKFANIFNVADTQVLVEVKRDSQGDPAVHTSTMIEGTIASVIYTMGGDTEAEAWDLAYKNLNEAIDQAAAEEIYADMVSQYNQHKASTTNT
jgi:hypothetical protein